MGLRRAGSSIIVTAMGNERVGGSFVLLVADTFDATLCSGLLSIGQGQACVSKTKLAMQYAGPHALQDGTRSVGDFMVIRRTKAQTQCR